MSSDLYTLVAARHGRFFINRNDTYIGRSLRHYGEWSEPEISLFEQIVRPGDFVVEAGANIGSHTVWLSKRVGEQGMVQAYEPARHTFQLLCANLVANECLNVAALQQAIAAQAGILDFPLLEPRQSWNFGGASMKKDWTQQKERVVATTLDAQSLERLDFIKADVEGFELELISGARQTIERQRPVVYIEINTAEIRDQAVAFFEPLGYTCWYYVTPMFSPDNWLGNADDIFNDFSFDMLCVPADRFEVTGMSRAGVNDAVISYSPTQIKWATPSWNQARVVRAT
ncbi:FkbM family methyltransferase [Collimonas sp. NPDC087041]|uniref:FkbM family methyltransferase n=1 Tax=Collimonas sp. NPDC087041 TaxID=3363960 RepID=UPI003826649D